MTFCLLESDGSEGFETKSKLRCAVGLDLESAVLNVLNLVTSLSIGCKGASARFTVAYVI